MRRPRWVRLVAAWLACWLPLVLSDGGWLHACAMPGYAVRDGAPAARAAVVAPAAMPSMAMAAEMAHADHAAHAGRDAGRGEHSGRHTAAHVCTCLGACCAALAVLPSGAAPNMIAVEERAYVAPTGRAEHEYVAAWVDFVLPFATAPPVAAAA